MAVKHSEFFTRTADEFLEQLCGYSRITEVWFVLWQGGGAYGFTEIMQFTGVSRSWLTEVLRRLLADALVRR
ncbi:unnamed protein product, partial [marine sediment metagenome]